MSLEKCGISEVDFDKIFKSWYNPIRNFVYYKIGDVQAAEDIAQDTFLKLWEKRDSIRIESVKSLLYTIANNLTINRFEHQKVSFKFTNNYSETNIVSTPENELEIKEFDKKLQNALAELDEKKRTVFLMNRIDELTYDQIAELQGVTVKAIEKRMSLALDFLRKRIDKNI
jgi:RNA polymerase sigma-70 factor (family 1)